MLRMRDLIIVGGGPAGAAAAVYAARKQLTTTIITSEWGGQSTVSTDIQNWIGTVSISGADLAKQLETHVKAYAGSFVEIAAGERATKAEKIDGGFVVTTGTGARYEGKTVLLAVGARRRQLEAPGAREFDQKGLTYCASCDGPLFSDQDVAVIGGGNAGFETAAQLLAYCKSVTLLDRGERFRADETTVQKVLKNPNMRAYNSAEIMEVVGEKFVNGLTWKDVPTGKVETLPVSGIFIEIGLIPNTDLADGLVEMNPIKQVVTNPKTQRTSVEGIWAAGDCTDALYHQNNIAVGDAIKALEDIYAYLRT